MWSSQLLVLAGFAAMMPFIPLFLKDELGIIDERTRGIWMSAFYFFGTFGYALFCPIWGALSDRFGVKPMLLRGTFGTAILFPLMAYSPNGWVLVLLRFLLPLGAGIGAGIMLGAAGLSGAMARYERLMLFLFTGLILGGVPDLVHEAQHRERFRPVWLFSLAAGICIALPMCLLGGEGVSVERLSPVQSFLTGLLEGMGTVVPGVSTSFVLIRLGWYQAYLSAFVGLKLPSLLLIVLGFAVSAFACMQLVSRLFDRYTGHAYYAVLGFLLVSVALVFPGFTLGREAWAQLAMLVIGITLVRLMGQFNT